MTGARKNNKTLLHLTAVADDYHTALLRWPDAPVILQIRKNKTAKPAWHGVCYIDPRAIGFDLEDPAAPLERLALYVCGAISDDEAAALYEKLGETDTVWYPELVAVLHNPSQTDPSKYGVGV